jgi:S1-C subfamily serine protease
VVWADKHIDLAIVKISIAKADYLELGDSDQIELGEDVYAIGNPIGFEFQRTVTKGIISGLNRTIKIEEDNDFVYMEDLIQTDSTINEGNSGGALINTSGELLGINTIKITDAQGIGFAVPINIVKPIIEKLSTTGKFEEAYLGIYGYDKEVIPYLNSSMKLESGIYVDSIALDGPVYNSGVMVGDIITKIDDVEINKMSELKKYIYSKSPGDKVKLTVKRNSKEFEVEIKLNYNL